MQIKVVENNSNLLVHELPKQTIRLHYYQNMYILISFLTKSQILFQGLQIEEIIDDTNSSLAMEIENMIEDFECVFKQEVSMDDEILEDPEDPGVSRRSWSPTPPPARPNQLDLFNPEKHNRTSYSFKNPQ